MLAHLSGRKQVHDLFRELRMAARAVAYRVDPRHASTLPSFSRSRPAALPRGAAISTSPMLFSYQKGPRASSNVRA